jgi:hypothetical protein
MQLATKAAGGDQAAMPQVVQTLKFELGPRTRPCQEETHRHLE